TTASAPAPRSRTASMGTGTSNRPFRGRSRGPSKSSVVAYDHDTDKEEQEEEREEGREEEGSAVAPEPESSNEVDCPAASESDITPTPPTPPPAPPVTRTRKAKEQTRLGVGRPVIAGGTGARAITKSISVPKKDRISRSTGAPSQETIIEEEPEHSPAGVTDPRPAAAQPVASGSLLIADFAPNTAPGPGSLASLEAIDKRVADALRPLHTQMFSLKSEVERLRTQVAVIPELQRTVQNLTTEVETLRRDAPSKPKLESQIDRPFEDLARAGQPSVTSPISPGTPGRRTQGKYGSLVRSGRSGPSTIPTSSIPISKNSINGRVLSMQVPGAQLMSMQAPSNSMNPSHPGFAQAVTGKRRRSSDESNITGVFDEGRQDEFSETELEKRVPRPTKKRAKLDSDWTGDAYDSSQQASGSGSSQPQFTFNQEQEDPVARRAQPFTIFSGPDESDNFATYADPPPPTNHLPDFFAPSDDPESSHSGMQTSTANAEENHNAFGFNFLPITSTPMQPMYPMSVPNFPHPEPPTSPSPAGERTYQPFGLPSSRRRSGSHRPASRQEADGNGTVNPASLTGRGSQELSSNIVSGMGLMSVPFMGDEGLPAPGPAKTMYGTERDTRFGDFGVEGVATGFWTGGKF
ncbi:hypothetical protein HWV62_2896, partial [Athelia sp. TMB]